MTGKLGFVFGVRKIVNVKAFSVAASSIYTRYAINRKAQLIATAAVTTVVT